MLEALHKSPDHAEDDDQLWMLDPWAGQVSPKQPPTVEPHHDVWSAWQPCHHSTQRELIGLSLSRLPHMANQDGGSDSSGFEVASCGDFTAPDGCSDSWDVGAVATMDACHSAPDDEAPTANTHPPDGHGQPALCRDVDEERTCDVKFCASDIQAIIAGTR